MILLIKLVSMTKSQLICQEVNLVIIFLKIVPVCLMSQSKEGIDPNYTIGPGDEIVIMLWGETELQNSYIVSTQGYIFVDNLGQIFVVIKS